MSNADLIKRLRAKAKRSEIAQNMGLSAERDIIENEAADALEQCERAKVELALENGKLRARLNRWEMKK